MSYPRWATPLALVWTTSFFLHFAWEMWQASFYQGMDKADHATAIWVCTKATFGDANIAITAYLVAALSIRTVYWLKAPLAKPLFIFLVVGLLITVLFEYLATEVLARWQYNENMPTLPLLGTGLLPLAQWIIVPLISFYASRLMYHGVLHKRSVRPEKAA